MTDDVCLHNRRLVNAFHQKYPMLNEEHREMMVKLPFNQLKKKLLEYEEWAKNSKLVI